MLDSQKLISLNERLANSSGHLQQILRGAIASFNDKDNPLRFTNSATAFRELLRELFAAIAPDAEIKSCSWYIPDSSSATGVTRRHRTLFSIYSFLDPAHFPRDFVSGIELLAKNISAKVGELSKLTHITKSTLSTSDASAILLFDSTIDLFLQLFSGISEAKSHLHEALAMELQEKLSDVFTWDFFDELDLLSTHTRPQYAEDIEVVIDEIDKKKIAFSGTGSVLCELQYGSDGDCRRGDGLEIEDSYGFTFSGEALTSNPKEVTVDSSDISVDTSPFYE